MKYYQVKVYPLEVFVEANNAQEAEETMLEELYQGEYQIEIESIKRIANPNA